jgi:hypothetical protein
MPLQLFVSDEQIVTNVDVTIYGWLMWLMRKLCARLCEIVEIKRAGYPSPLYNDFI